MLKNKTMFRLFLLLGVIIFTLVILVGCDGRTKKVGKILSEIKQDYYEQFVYEKDKTVSDVIVDYYVGRYNGYYVLMLSYKGEPFFDGCFTVCFDEYSITYSNSNTLRAWKDGAFYDLEELYKLGELSKKDIKQIIEQYHILCE